VFLSVDTKFDELIAAGNGRAVQLVKEELDSVGTPEMRAWAKNHSGLFVPMAIDVQAAGAKIEASYPELMDPKGLHESADAYVIAFAAVHGGTVVTQETTAAEKRNPRRTHYIPDVCRELGISCIGLLGLMRREGWKF
jgi:hypothetical protein